MAKRKFVNLVHLKWLDSHSPASGTKVWFYPEEISTKIKPIDTVGYIIEENKISVTVAAQVSDHTVGGVITIPRCAIVKRKKLK